MKRFLISVVVIILIALYFPAIGRKVRELNILKIGIFFTFLITGIELQIKDIINETLNLRNITAVIFSSLLFFPVLTFMLSKLFFIGSTEIKFGIYVLSLSPATIASGTILTRIAKGNITLSILICVVTNLTVLFTIPFFLNFFLILEGVYPNLSLYAVTNSLIYTILLPMLLGQALQLKLKGIRLFFQRQYFYLSKFYQLVILLIIFNAVSRSSSELFYAGFKIIHISLFMIILHLIVILVNFGLSKIINLNYTSMKAFIIHTSQKTLTIPYVIWADCVYDEFPLAIIPAIVYHLVQTIFDPFLAHHFAKQADN